jgi:nucleoside-diphosphate-sugar epimerase
MTKQVALVTGASGVVGRGLVDYLSSLEGWEVIGVARRAFDGLHGRVRFLPVDLLDSEDCRAKFNGLNDVTHIFYAAFLEQPTEAQQASVNAAMLRNVVEVIDEVSPVLQHVSLMEGPKAYGCHFGPYKTPARESDPRHLPPNFYYGQEDFLRELHPTKAWTWSALRPSLVCGPGVGHPMNMSMAIAVYASVCKELQVPLWFPGTHGAYTALFEATDTAHLARAAAWAATEPRCSGEVFNITNGDLFRWQHLWPRIAACFGLEPAPPMPLRLGAMMADKGPLWNSMVEKYGLRPYPYEELVSWMFAEFVFRIEYDIISDMTKARSFGFHEVLDTEVMFERIIRDLRSQRYIP